MSEDFEKNKQKKKNKEKNQRKQQHNNSKINLSKQNHNLKNKKENKLPSSSRYHLDLDSRTLVLVVETEPSKHEWQ